MTEISPAQPGFETTPSALREKLTLQRHFRRFDVFFYLVCTVVTIDTIGAVASNGAQGFTWLIFLGWVIVGGIRVRGGSGSPATAFGLIP